MTNKKRNHMSELPTMQKTHSVQPGKPEIVPKGDKLEPITTTAPISPEWETITMSFPVFRWEDGYAKRNIDVRLTGSQAEGLKSIQLGLEKKEETLANGRYVSNPVDAVRWLIENAIKSFS